jgi:cytochrome c5
MVIRQWILAAVSCNLVAACGGSAPSSTSAATENTSVAAESPAAAQPTAKLNIDEIFPPGKGRDLVLNNCTNCHTIVPIVVLQMTKDAWDLNAREHRDRVTALTDAEVAVLYEYLAANFNPDRPVPKLPEELLKTWTAY